jgi:hypothetical protein
VSSRRDPRPKRARLALFAALALLAIAGNQSAATAAPTWIPIDTGAPPGSPATVSYDAGASSTNDSFFDINIPGFWSEDAPDTSGLLTHEKIHIPGSGTFHIRGAPQLPVIRLTLAIVTDASALSLLSYTPSATQTLPGYLPWPDSEPQQDHPEGEPEGYERDDRIYNDNALWPATDFDISATPGNLLGSIKGVTVEVHPFKCNPVTGELQVVTQLRIGIGHPGVVQPPRTLTKERMRLAAKVFDNWPPTGGNIAANDIKFEAEYLMIYPPEVDSIIQPLVDLKKTRGYRVTKLPIQPAWATCNDFRGQIQNWYNASDLDKDHYCLLVGDVSEIPNCISPPLMTESYPLGIPTDDLYGSMDGNDLNEEVFVGRISFDDTTDLRQQIQKIVLYQTVGFDNADYEEAMLVAHKEEAPEKYVGAHESVKNAFYVVQPTFSTQYGSAGGSNAGVVNNMNFRVGLVAYRGHGSDTEWTGWYFGMDPDFNQGDIDQLHNGPYTPVVWSFACKNANIETEDSLGEIFMEAGDDGAVAFYGSTRNSYTTPNHELDRQMFQGVYTVGLTTISHAIQFGELMMTNIEDFHNAWMYLLLGDPDMEIRTGPPTIWDIVAPPAIPPCGGGCPPVDITVLDDQGQPLEGVLVAAWKEGFVATSPNSPAMKVDELLDNRYTNASGQAQIPVSSMTEGTLFYTIQDEMGNTVLDSIHVGSLVDAPVSTRQVLSFRATPNVFRNETFFDFGAALPQNGRLAIYDATGRLVSRLDVARGERGVNWRALDRDGTRLRAGILFAKLSVGEKGWNTRVVVLR